MKKLIVMLLVSAAAIVAQAASVNWIVSNVYTPTASILAPGSAGGGAKMTMAEAANLVISVFWKNGDNWDVITPVDGKTTLTAAGIKASGALWSQADAVANRDAEYNAYFKVVLTYTDATGTYSLTKENPALSLKTIESKAANATFNMNNATWAYTPSGSGDIPEPTSGLLLLVGGATLALRRKRA